MLFAKTSRSCRGSAVKIKGNLGKRKKAKAERLYEKEKQLFQGDPHPEIRFPGGGGTPYDGLCGRLHPKGVSFWSLPSGI